MIEDVSISQVNVYAIVREELGKEDRESFIPSPFGGSAIREWKCGCIVVRRVEYDYATGKYTMKDSYYPCEKHRHIEEKIRRKLR